MILSTGLLLCINWIIFVFKSSSSSSHLHLQVIFIFGSGSSLNLDRHKTSSLDLDHHSIWIIITGLDLDHHHQIQIITRYGSSLDWIWIITRSGSLRVIITGSGSQLDLDLLWSSSYVLSHDSSCHRKFYRASLLSSWVYAYLLIGLWQPLHLTYSSKWWQPLHLTYSS